MHLSNSYENETMRTRQHRNKLEAEYERYFGQKPRADMPIINIVNKIKIAKQEEYLEAKRKKLKEKRLALKEKYGGK